MTESASSSEFLLGLEEYLKYLKEPAAASWLHGVSRSLQAEDPQLAIARSYLQQLTARLPPELVALADLDHSMAKLTQADDAVYRTVLTHCARVLKNKGQELDLLADLDHSMTKSQLPQDVYRTVLHYNARVLKNKGQELDLLADLDHSMTKSQLPQDVYRAVLLYNTNFIKSRLDVETSLELDILVGLADLCHSTRTTSQVKDCYRAVLHYNTRVLKTQGLENLARDTELVLRSMDQEDFDQFVIHTQLGKLDQQFPNDKIFRSILNYLKLDLDNKSLQDAFSRSQIKSKIWLIDQLAHVQAHYKQVAVLAGWFGQIKSIYDQQLTYGKMRIVELDRSACEISDHVFNASNLENHKVKSVCADVNQLTLHKNGYEWSVENFRDGTTYNEKFLPDLIINTSAEHMTEEWYHQLRFKQLDSDPIVAIQSNNLFDIPEHINCVHSVDHMMKKYPMREVLFAGELQLKGYKRVMLIGRP
jgi:hypothetical protein